MRKLNLVTGEPANFSQNDSHNQYFDVLKPSIPNEIYSHNNATFCSWLLSVFVFRQSPTKELSPRKLMIYVSFSS